MPWMNYDEGEAALGLDEVQEMIQYGSMQHGRRNLWTSEALVYSGSKLELRQWRAFARLGLISF